MDKQRPVSDPFALMMDPQGVIQAMERSDRLARLQRRVCRPLDKPLIARKPSELSEFDDVIDEQPELAEATDLGGLDVVIDEQPELAEATDLGGLDVVIDEQPELGEATDLCGLDVVIDEQTDTGEE